MKRLRHLLRRPRFVVEKWVQRGALHQLVLMSCLIAAVAVVGGVAAWALTPRFDSLSSAIWWSFLRLTDPGYLGDDEGVALRTVSTVVTVLGYVLFMGSLIAIMTQWLARAIRKLESGLTPISMENHFVILGWTNRTAEIIKKLLAAGGRLERFFARRSGSSTLRVVVLAEEVDSERRLELRESLGADWSESHVFLRSGSSLQQEHLARLDLRRASVVIVPGADFELGGAELNDTRVVKTLLNIETFLSGTEGGRSPCVVAELFDPRKVSIARASTTARTEIIAGDRLISRVLSQSLRHSGAGAVLLSLLTHREANGLYLRTFEQFAGHACSALIETFPNAVVLGFVSMGGPTPGVHLNPGPDLVPEKNDLLIFVARRYDDCVPSGVPPAPPAGRPARSLPPYPEPELRRYLILGWSYKIPTLIAELLESGVGRYEVTILSRVGEDERDQAFGHLELTERISLRNVVGDYSLEHDLAKLSPQEFDRVLFLASGWLDTSEEADARTILGLLLLRSMLEDREGSPEILVELLDPDNATLLGQAADVCLISPRMLSHLLAHVGLLPELNAVVDDLICSGGSEVKLRAPKSLGFDSGGVTFAEVQEAAASMGCVGLGFYVAPKASAPRRVELNPDRERRWTFAKGDRIVLLSRDGQSTETSV